MRVYVMALSLARGFSARVQAGRHSSHLSPPPARLCPAPARRRRAPCAVQSTSGHDSHSDDRPAGEIRLKRGPTLVAGPTPVMLARVRAGRTRATFPRRLRGCVQARAGDRELPARFNPPAGTTHTATTAPPGK